MTTTRTRHARGASLLELITVFVILGILGTGVTVGWQSTVDAAKVRSAKNTVNILASSQTAYHQRFGSFEDDPAVLVVDDPEQAYVASNMPTIAGEASLATGTVSGQDAVGIAYHGEDGTCVTAVVFPTRARIQTYTSTHDATDATCHGNQALTIPADQSW